MRQFRHAFLLLLVVLLATTRLLADTPIHGAGDWTGTPQANTVVGLQTRSVSASAPSTGNTLGWGGSSWAPSVLNLAGGANYVTGTLPAANLPNLAGDVTGAITSNTVVQMTGSSSVVNALNGVSIDFLTTSKTTASSGRLNFIGDAAQIWSAYHYGGADYTITATDGNANLYIGTAPGYAGLVPTVSTFAASTIAQYIGESGAAVTLTTTGVTTSGIPAFFASSSDVTIGATSADKGGGAGGILDLAPVTTAPTSLPSTHTGIYTAAGQYTGLNSSGITWPYELTGVTVIQQTSAPSTSAGSGSVGNGLTIISQAGQAATGASNAGGAGSVLLVRSSAGGNSALANGGNSSSGEFGSGGGGAATGGSGNGGNGGNTILFSGIGGASSGGTPGTNGSVNIRIGGNTGSDTAIAGPNASGTNIFDVVGAFGIHSVTKSGNYTIDSGSTPDTIIYCNFSAAHTITLPAPTADRLLLVKDIAGTAVSDPITIARHASETIDGVAGSYTLATNYGHVSLHSDGTNWWVIQ
jgi:hypothetical protein